MSNRKRTLGCALKCRQVLIMFTFCAALCEADVFDFSESIVAGCLLEAGNKYGENIFVRDSPEIELAEDYMIRCGFRRKGELKTACTSETFEFKADRWPTKNLTYNVSGYFGTLDSLTIDEEIAKAFALWSEHTDLIFSPESGEVDISIKFVSRNHGDGINFDRRTPDFMTHNKLTHIFIPDNGTGVEVHFDVEDEWNTNVESGQNLFLVATHALGHALGLHHSDNQWSIMYPRFDSKRDVKLYKDDIVDVQVLYGPKTINEVPIICNVTTIDAIFNTTEGETYVFKGKYYWGLSKDENATSGYPKLIATKWEGLPSNIDAAYTDENGTTYFFKGSQYWAYQGEQMDQDFPRYIRDSFHGIPDNIDAATSMYGSKQIWFSKGTEYWIFDPDQTPHVDSRYPEPNSDLQGVPSTVDAVLNQKDYVSFFEGTNFYQQDKGSIWWNIRSPENIASRFFGCPSIAYSFMKRLGNSLLWGLGAIGNFAKNIFGFSGRRLNF